MNHTCNLDQPCRLCKRDVPASPKPLARKSLPVCSHLDPGTVRVPGSSRAWRRCKGGHGSTAAGAEGLVCRCSTPGTGVWRRDFECGPKCPGFNLSTEPQSLADYPQWQPVAPPVVNPTKPRLIVSLAVGDEGERTHALTAASQRRYAEKVGADYAVIKGKTQSWFMLEKFRYAGYVGHYPGGTLCLDADIWVSRDAPDLFYLVPPEKVGVSIAHDLHTHGLMGKFNQELAEVCQSQGVAVPKGSMEIHWNSGLVVLRPQYAEYWSPPVKPIPRHWIAEELWSKVTTFRKGWELHDLTHPAIHWQWWRDQQLALLGPPLPPFIHPAGLTQQPGGLQRRLDMFRVLEASGR